MSEIERPKIDMNNEEIRTTERAGDQALLLMFYEMWKKFDESERKKFLEEHKDFVGGQHWINKMEEIFGQIRKNEVRIWSAKTEEDRIDFAYVVES